MTLADRIQAFVKMGTYLHQLADEEVERYSLLAQSRNAWFTLPNVRFALQAWAKLLQEDNLNKWLAAYSVPDTQALPKKVGVVMAGNIPLVGFHDLLCVLLSGHQLYAKTSSSDPLPELLAKKLLEIEPRFGDALFFQEMLKGMNAYIATGSDNTSRYFEYYFRDKAHLIRKSRSSCAMLTGQETEAELKSLGRDMLQYWGLGCRSVSKLYVPEQYNFTPLFEALESWADVQNHHKWTNNYDYRKSILLINGQQHFDTGFLLFKEDIGLSSPVTLIHYQHYKDAQELEQLIEQHTGRIQCIVGSAALPTTTTFGQAQRPALWDYADGIDTLSFLLNL